MKEHYEAILSTHTLFQTGVQREHIRDVNRMLSRVSMLGLIKAMNILESENFV